MPGNSLLVEVSQYWKKEEAFNVSKYPSTVHPCVVSASLHEPGMMDRERRTGVKDGKVSRQKKTHE